MRRSVTKLGWASGARDKDALVMMTEISAGVGWNAILECRCPEPVVSGAGGFCGLLSVLRLLWLEGSMCVVAGR